MLEAEEVKALAAEIHKRRNEAPNRRWRTPEDLRERALAYARECRQHGEPVADIAGRLGMVEATLYRWLRRESERAAPRLRSVAIVPSREEAEEERAEVSTGKRVRLITPQGFVVEGLDASMVIEVLRGLG
jgi:transposase-like protein